MAEIPKSYGLSQSDLSEIRLTPSGSPAEDAAEPNEAPLPEGPAKPETTENPAAVDELTRILDEALDEDDLPEHHPPASPPIAAALARPDPDTATATAAAAAAAAASAVAAVAPAASDEPSIATSLEVPPLKLGSLPADGEGGGEWELLTGKVRHWFGSGEPQKLLNGVGGPLKAVAYLLAALLVLRIYRSLVGTIDGIPLVSGLLELVGLIALPRFCLLRLVKRSEREQVVGNLQRRWNDFRGKV